MATTSAIRDNVYKKVEAALASTKVKNSYKKVLSDFINERGEYLNDNIPGNKMVFGESDINKYFEAMGINKTKTILLAAIVGAVIISVGAITQLSYTGRFTTSAGMGSLNGIFKALAVILISGSFSRIFNDAVGCVIGAFIVAGLFNVLTLMGVPSGTGQDICLGMVVLVCGILSSLGYKGVMK